MAMTNKQGFGGQWVEVVKAGSHVDNKGVRVEIDGAFLERTAANFNPDVHEPPAVIGHPETDAPAYGWVCALRVGPAGSLEAQFCDTDPEFEEMVRAGRFKKRSVAIYLDENKAPGGRVPALRHVGFLGAQPPAIKGLRNVHFGEGDAVTFDINLSEGDSSMKDEEVGKVVDGVWERFKAHLGIGKEKNPAQADFSESDVRSIVADAVEAVEAKFTETVDEQKKEIERLSSQVSAQTGKTTRAEIVAFCEGLGGDKFPPAFKRMGVVEFMETLAAVGDAQKVTVVSFSEEGGVKKETKTETPPLTFFKDFLTKLGPFIAFGEQFGRLDGAVTTGAELVDPARMATLREGMGTPVKKEDGGAK